jgi:uncharacterized protein (TIGR02145 family)
MKDLIFILGMAICYLSVNGQETGIFKDSRDGKTYQTVKIGNQWVMAENLVYKPDTGNYWFYENDLSNLEKYGYLYDWQTAKTLAPAGWHLPSEEEWKTILTFLGGDKNEILLAIKPGESSGLNILLGGFRHKEGQFLQQGITSGFWSATAFDDNRAFGFYCNTQAGEASILSGSKTSGFSVRLIQD